MTARLELSALFLAALSWHGICSADGIIRNPGEGRLDAEGTKGS